MRILEKIKLAHRAYTYKTRYDIGGIKFALASVKKYDTVMDIGSHKAGYLYYFQQLVGAQGKVYAFEPQTVLFQYLTKIRNLFGWDNVTVEHLALSDQQGNVTLYVPCNKHGDSSPGATIVNNLDRKDISITQEIGTNTLDLYCKAHNLTPNFLKIDVEGNELKVFKGGVDTLKKHKPKILFECEAQHVGREQVLETFKYLEDLGYTGRFILGDKFLPLLEFTFEKYQDLNKKDTYCNNFIFE